MNYIHYDSSHKYFMLQIDNRNIMNLFSPDLWKWKNLHLFVYAFYMDLLSGFSKGNFH